MTKPTQSSNTKKMLVGLALACGLMGIGYYAWSTLHQYSAGLPPEPTEQTASVTSRPMRPPSPEEMRQNFTKMLGQLNLNDDQQKQIDALMNQGMPTSREEFQSRREQLESILTPEQNEQLHQAFRQRMNQRMEEARQKLSPEDFKALQKRMEERRARFQGGGGNRPSGPPPGH